MCQGYHSKKVKHCPLSSSNLQSGSVVLSVNVLENHLKNLLKMQIVAPTLAPAEMLIK